MILYLRCTHFVKKIIVFNSEYRLLLWKDVLRCRNKFMRLLNTIEKPNYFNFSFNQRVAWHNIILEEFNLNKAEQYHVIPSGVSSSLHPFFSA